MKKLLCILAVIGLFFAGNETAFAQGNSGKEVVTKRKGKLAAAKKIAVDLTMDAAERAGFLTETMSNLLSLNPQQVNEVSQINLSTCKKVDNLRQNRGDLKAFQRQLKTVYRDRDSAIKRVLNSDQISAYRSVKRALKETRRSTVADAR